MAIMASAGAQLNVVAGIPSTFDEAGYTGQTYTRVGEIQNIGEFLREYALITFNDLSSRATRKLKGSYNNGTLGPSIAMDPEDDGQNIIEGAVPSDDPITCEVVLPDGTAYYFCALVMSFRPNIGGTDDVLMATTSMEITHHDGVKVAASGTTG